MKALFVALLLITAGQARADIEPQQAEPEYCDINQLKAVEIKSAVSGLKSLHGYQIGRVLVTGLAVGNSNATALIKYDTHYSNTSSADKYCTWYFNDGNSQAKKAFNWHYLNKPTSTKVVNEYVTQVGAILDSNAINMVDCAERKRFIAMGCDGMKHRGPTVFGMFLAYSGCSAKSATKIVNAIWGTNGIPTSVREQLSQKAYELGQAHSDKSSRLRTQLLAN
ncbi:MAG: hypothetical protein ABL958_09365 [Bdellovibrionia bacterium]